MRETRKTKAAPAPPVLFSSPACARWRAAFTLLEVMIALVVMCVVACGMWIACATGSRAQQKARQLEERRLIMGLSFAEARRGCLPPGAVTNCGGWRIEAGASDSGSPSNGWRSVTISRTNEPGAEWTVYLKDEGRIAPQ